MSMLTELMEGLEESGVFDRLAMSVLKEKKRTVYTDCKYYRCLQGDRVDLSRGQMSKLKYLTDLDDAYRLVIKDLKEGSSHGD